MPRAEITLRAAKRQTKKKWSGIKRQLELNTFSSVGGLWRAIHDVHSCGFCRAYLDCDKCPLTEERCSVSPRWIRLAKLMKSTSGFDPPTVKLRRIAIALCNQVIRDSEAITVEDALKMG